VSHPVEKKGFSLVFLPVPICSGNPRKGKQDVEDLRLWKEESSGGWW
jgi:hypothetical protein